MARYLIVGEAGSDSVWLIDTLSKSVEEISASEADADAGEDTFVGAIKAMRGGDQTLINGVNVAVAVNSRSPAASHQFFNS